MVLILIGGISLKENGQEDEKILLIIIGAIILIVSLIGNRMWEFLIFLKGRSGFSQTLWH